MVDCSSLSQLMGNSFVRASCGLQLEEFQFFFHQHEFSSREALTSRTQSFNFMTNFLLFFTTPPSTVTNTSHTCEILELHLKLRLTFSEALCGLLTSFRPSRSASESLTPSLPALSLIFHGHNFVAFLVFFTEHLDQQRQCFS